jgi:hypothetical protein
MPLTFSKQLHKHIITHENFVGKPNWKQNPLIEETGLGFKDSDQVITKP